MTLWDILAFILQSALVFVVSTALFDALHWVLHQWEGSRIPLLRTFSSWHWVHHKFLGLDMQINPAYARANIWFHILPEYLTSMAGTLIFLFVFPWPAIAFVSAIRTIMLVMTLKEEGLDYNHMSMDRVGGQQGLLWVNNNYHAMHHLYPHNFFSSFANVFDLLFGTTCQIKGRHFLVTGASGAFGSAMVKALERRGGIVETAKSGVRFLPRQLCRHGRKTRPRRCADPLARRQDRRLLERQLCHLHRSDRSLHRYRQDPPRSARSLGPWLRGRVPRRYGHGRAQGLFRQQARLRRPRPPILSQRCPALSPPCPVGLHLRPWARAP